MGFRQVHYEEGFPGFSYLTLQASAIPETRTMLLPRARSIYCFAMALFSRSFVTVGVFENRSGVVPYPAGQVDYQV